MISIASAEFLETVQRLFVVSIVSAAGLIIPKTSSRAITSPAGTADTMEAITNVSLELSEMKRVVEETGACLSWGGAVNLSPADDLLIRIARALELDGVGDTAKVRSEVEADRLASLFTRVGEACGIHIRCIITDGSHPIGSGIGPVEEAKDLIAVRQNKKDAPTELRQRAGRKRAFIPPIPTVHQCPTPLTSSEGDRKEKNINANC